MWGVTLVLLQPKSKAQWTQTSTAKESAWYSQVEMFSTASGDWPWSRGHQQVAHRVPVAASMGFPPPLFSDPSWAQAAKMEAARVCSVCIRSSSWMDREWRLVRAASSSPSSSDVLACASWVGDDCDFFILDSRWWRLRGGGLWGCPPPRFSLSEAERGQIRWWPTQENRYGFTIGKVTNETQTGHGLCIRHRNS